MPQTAALQRRLRPSRDPDLASHAASKENSPGEEPQFPSSPAKVYFLIPAIRTGGRSTGNLCSAKTVPGIFVPKRDRLTRAMQDHELVERPCKGWTPWAKGPGDHDIEKVWWMARVLHFAKLNVSCWFEGSEIVGIWHWGYRREKWTMKLKPADWQPLPEVYRLAREAEKQAAVDLFRDK